MGSGGSGGMGPGGRGDYAGGGLGTRNAGIPGTSVSGPSGAYGDRYQYGVSQPSLKPASTNTHPMTTDGPQGVYVDESGNQYMAQTVYRKGEPVTTYTPMGTTSTPTSTRTPR